jgi:hypothetical protein
LIPAITAFPLQISRPVFYSAITFPFKLKIKRTMKFSIHTLRALLLLPFLAFALAIPAVAADEDDETPLERRCIT